VRTTHYMEEAARLCDRVAILDHGRVIALGAPAELVASLGADQIVEFRIASDAGEIQDSPLRRLPGVTGMRAKETKEANGGSYLLTVSEIGAALPALLAELERQNLKLDQLTTHQATPQDGLTKLTRTILPAS